MVKSSYFLFASLLFLVACGGPGGTESPTPSTDLALSLLLEQNTSEEAFKSSLSDVGTKYNVKFTLEEFVKLDSSTLASGFCNSNLARVQVSGAKEAQAVTYLTEAATSAGSENPIADIDPRYSMGQADVARSSSASEFSPQATSGLTGKGVRIAILDTGFGKSEIAFSQWSTFKSVIGQRNFTSADNEDYYDRYTQHEGLNYSYEGHGTPIAVLAGGSYGEFKGVAPEAEIMPIKVCGDDGKCLVSHVVQGICYALNNAPIDANGQRKLSNLVINLSLGGDRPSKSLYEVLKFALENNVAVVTSAGNDGDGNSATKDPLQYPAAFGVTLDGKDAVPEDGYTPLPGLIVVAALEQKNGSYVPAPFSSQASYVSLAAPGVSVKSGQAASVSFSDQFAGTSFATPQVAGALALLREGFPNLPLDSVSDLDLKELLLDSATLLACDGCTPEAVGKGQLNVNTSPIIVSEFVATSVYNGTATTLTWEIANANDGGVECALDIQSDGTVDSVFSPCQETYSFDYLYPSFGTFKSTLSVRNSLGISTQRSIDVIIKSWSRQDALREFIDTATDSKGNVYVGGNGYSDDDYSNSYDAWVLKFDAAGNEVWRYKFDSGEEDRVNAVATIEGNVYVLGQTAGKLGAELSGYEGFYDMFLGKLSTQGELIWIRQFGGNTDDYASDLAVGWRYKDFQELIYVLGQVSYGSDGEGSNLYIGVFRGDGTECSVTPPPADVFGQPESLKFTNGYTGYYTEDRLYVAGSGYFLELFPRSYCGDDADPVTFEITDSLNIEGASGVAVDADNNAYIVGSNEGEMFVYKRDASDAARDWKLVLEQGNQGTVSDVIVDSSNHLYVTGTTGNGEFVTYGTLFIKRIRLDRIIVWERQWAGSRDGEDARANRLAAADGSVFVAGSTFYDPSPDQLEDNETHGLILKVNANGDIQ
jgi:hypothetical protein